jgi:tetratricopeptide (TPR) repeat protein
VQHRYDVFLSCARQDRAAVLPVVAALRAEGLQVFVDDEQAEEFEGVTQTTVAALARSKVLLAHYSARYPTRPACQWELTTAYLTAERDGDPSHRVLCVNPEAGTDHLAPVELADRLAPYPTSPAGLAALAQQVRAAAESVTGPMGGGPVPMRPPRLADRVLGPRRFVGRFPQLWQTHAVLHANGTAAADRPEGGAVAMVCGLPGTGKTTLAEQYALLFTGAYPGGAFWLGPLGGDLRTDTDEALSGYGDHLRGIARQLGIPTAGTARRRLAGDVAEFLTERGARCLWIVDDIPPGLDPAQLDELLIPSPLVSTIVTGRAPPYPLDAAVVELAGLTAEEGRSLFAAAHEPEDETEQRAVDEIVARFGGHPLCLRLAGEALRNRQPIMSVAGYVQALDPAAPDAVRRVLHDAFSALEEAAQLVLAMAALLGPAPIQPGLIASVVGAALDRLGVPAAQTGDLIGSAVNQLAHHHLAERGPGGWLVHPLVADAVRAVWPVAPDLAEASAVAVAALLGDPALPGLADLLLHARVLTSCPAVPEDLREDLLRRLAAHYQRVREPVTAAVLWGELLAQRPDGIDDLLAAAETELDIGRYGTAGAHTLRAQALATARNDRGSAYRAGLRTAAALDACTQYDDAAAIWAGWADPATGRPPEWLPVVERSRAVLAKATSLRLRGELRPAIRLLTGLLAAPEPAVDGADGMVTGRAEARELAAQRLAARLELARLYLLAGQPHEAMAAAEAVAEAYRHRGMPSHHRRLAALGVTAEATLRTQVARLRARTADRAERQLRALHNRYQRSLGRADPLTLAAGVEWGLALLQLGRPRAAREALTRSEHAVVRWLGPDDPLRLRALYGLALASSRLGEYTHARDLLAFVCTRQRAQLGAHHPDSLESQLEYGIARYLTGDAEGARLAFDEAARELSSAAGWRGHPAGVIRGRPAWPSRRRTPFGGRWLGRYRRG